jgi:hypothetical protein
MKRLLLIFLLLFGASQQVDAFGLGKEGITFSRSGKPGSGNKTARIVVSNSIFPANSATGTVIGTLSVLNGIVGSYTFTFTSNPGVLFQIVGTSLQVSSATIAAGTYPIIVHAVNGVSIIDTPMTLTAIDSGKILLVDAVSHVLLVDAVSRVCRAGGC